MRKEDTKNIPKKFNNGNPKHIALENMIEMLSTQMKSGSHLDDLIEELKHRQLGPVVIYDRSDEIGDMQIIRTQNSLPGTRHFHGQYISGEGIEPFLQQLSFEFQPGKQAMQFAYSLIEEKFPVLRVVTKKEGDFVLWELDNGYMLWLKKMTKDDLISDQYNAYTASDVGTIQVTLEMDIHSEPIQKVAEN